MKWRLLKRIEDEGARQMAIDEAMLKLRAQEKIPNTLRFFTWKPRAITIGYFQSLDKEVDTEKCLKENVDVIRRYTGGGAVFHDKEITYSIVVPEKEIKGDIIESYKKICAGITKGLEKIGITAEFKPINDIIVNGKKISGNAQTRRDGVILQHGTLLLDLDIETMFSLLKVPDEKIKDKMIKNVKERLTSVRKELGKEITLDEIQQKMTEGFEEALNAEFVVEELSEEEEKLSQEIYSKKYSTKEWTNSR